jgi:hypothetical protein
MVAMPAIQLHPQDYMLTSFDTTFHASCSSLQTDCQGVIVDLILCYMLLLQVLVSLVLANKLKFQFRPRHDQRTYFRQVQNLINVREYRKGNAKMENTEKLAK